MEEKECTIDIALPDKRISEKKNEKVVIEKCQDFKREIARMWSMRTVRELLAKRFCFAQFVLGAKKCRFLRWWVLYW